MTKLSRPLLRASSIVSKVVLIGALITGSLGLAAGQALAAGKSLPLNGTYAQWWTRAFNLYAGTVTSTGQYRSHAFCVLQSTVSGPWKRLSNGVTYGKYVSPGSCDFGVTSAVPQEQAG